ncbi:ligand-binding sensor domain-containing protein [Hymenobacter glaciei]
MLHFFRWLAGVVGVMLVAGMAQAQSTAGYGDWQLHLPTNHPIRLADDGDRVYVVAENAFYFFDKKLNTTQVLSHRDGLSDVAAVAVAYDSTTRQTVVAYRNTNIDVLTASGRVHNLSDVLRKSIQGRKVINQLSVEAGRAYLSTTFGLVVIDLNKLEVSDTYSNIGPGGTVVNVYDAAVANGYLYAATSAGLLRGPLTSNLLDYRSWTQYLPVPLSTTQQVYHYVAAYNGKVYAAVGAMFAGSVYVFNPAGAGAWQGVPNTYTAQFRNLRASSIGILLIDDDAGVRRIDAAEKVSVVVAPVRGNSIQDAVRSRDGSYYLANYQAGLQRLRPGQPAETFLANGPETNLAFGLLADARTNTVDVFTGAYSERYQPNFLRGGFYEYANGQWTNITATTFPNPTDFPNPTSPVHGTRTPDGTLYVANYGGGLLEWQGPGKFRRFGQNTPAANPLLGTFGDANRVEITDVAATPEGKVWVVNRHLRQGISGLSLFDPAATTWQVIPSAPGLDALDRIALDNYGYAWVSVSRKADRGGGSSAAPGIFAIDPDNANPPRFFTMANGLPDNQIYELAKDRRGYMWAATIKGVAVFNDPSGPFQSTQGFTLPSVQRGEGTGFPALFTEAVRAIAVDGGDRKWFGTDHGLWLFSPDADEALLHFTTANSPLPSDRIVDVKVNDKTGEVWVATDAGVVTYRGGATITEGEPKCAAAFPNPVRPDFQGLVGITGLANNAIVKITDVAGHLVYATTAAGGAVTWNMTMPDGQRVRSGIYLVLSTDADGKNGCVSKVAVLSR